MPQNNKRSPSKQLVEFVAKVIPKGLLFCIGHRYTHAEIEQLIQENKRPCIKKAVQAYKQRQIIYVQEPQKMETKKQKIISYLRVSTVQEDTEKNKQPDIIQLLMASSLLQPLR